MALEEDRRPLDLPVDQLAALDAVLAPGSRSVLTSRSRDAGDVDRVVVRVIRIEYRPIRLGQSRYGLLRALVRENESPLVEEESTSPRVRQC